MSKSLDAGARLIAESDRQAVERGRKIAPDLLEEGYRVHTHETDPKKVAAATRAAVKYIAQRDSEAAAKSAQYSNFQGVRVHSCR